MGILTVAVILAMFGFTISQIVRGRMPVLLRIFCFAILLIILGLFILLVLISMGILGGDVVKAIGNLLLVGSESIRAGFDRLSGVSFFDAIDKISGFIVLGLILGIIAALIILKVRR